MAFSQILFHFPLSLFKEKLFIFIPLFYYKIKFCDHLSIIQRTSVRFRPEKPRFNVPRKIFLYNDLYILLFLCACFFILFYFQLTSMSENLIILFQISNAHFVGDLQYLFLCRLSLLTSAVCKYIGLPAHFLWAKFVETSTTSYFLSTVVSDRKQVLVCL